MKEIYFNRFYKSFNIFSIILILISIAFLITKGLNFGVDFKGGALIEIRSADKNISISNIRDVFNKMNLKGVSVKSFGNETDFIVKFQSDNLNNKTFIKEIKDSVSKSFGNSIDFRRVENVGPKVSSELLRSGIIAICLSLFAMMVYIWVRFEWQFSIGTICNFS